MVNWTTSLSQRFLAPQEIRQVVVVWSNFEKQTNMVGGEKGRSSRFDDRTHRRRVLPGVGGRNSERM